MIFLVNGDAGRGVVLVSLVAWWEHVRPLATATISKYYFMLYSLRWCKEQSKLSSFATLELLILLSDLILMKWTVKKWFHSKINSSPPVFGRHLWTPGSGLFLVSGLGYLPPCLSTINPCVSWTIKQPLQLGQIYLV